MNQLNKCKQLARKGLQFYPHSKAMRRQYFKQTLHLLETGKHMVLTGKFPRRVQ